MAEDGQQAIDQVQARGERGLDVVLMDIQMPVMDGITAAELICGKWRPTCP